MKRLLPVLTVLAIIAAAGTSSCKKEAETYNSTIAFSTMTGSATYTLLNSAKDFNRDSDLVYFDSASIVMPTVIYNQDISKLQDTIIAAAFDTVSIDHAQAMNSAFVAAASESGYQIEPTQTRPGQQFYSDGNTIISGDVFSLTPHLLTYRISKEIYQPGDAHGLTVNRYITYLTDKGCLMPLSYIFTPEGIAELPGVIASRAKDLARQIGKTDINSLPANDNYYIALDGSIVFVYEPYEAASFSQGEIAIPFYSYQLREFMTAEGLALFNLDIEDPDD